MEPSKRVSVFTANPPAHQDLVVSGMKQGPTLPKKGNPSIPFLFFEDFMNKKYLSIVLAFLACQSMSSNAQVVEPPVLPPPPELPSNPPNGTYEYCSTYGCFIQVCSGGICVTVPRTAFQLEKNELAKPTHQTLMSFSSINALNPVRSARLNDFNAVLFENPDSKGQTVELFAPSVDVVLMGKTTIADVTHVELLESASIHLPKSNITMGKGSFNIKAKAWVGLEGEILSIAKHSSRSANRNAKNLSVGSYAFSCFNSSLHYASSLAGPIGTGAYSVNTGWSTGYSPLSGGIPTSYPTGPNNISMNCSGNSMTSTINLLPKYFWEP